MPGRVILNQSLKIFLLAVSGFFFSASLQSKSHGIQNMEFMTAKEMQAKVLKLTGIKFKEFLKEESILGKIDTEKRTRSNNKPNLGVINFFKKHAKEFAKATMKREDFLYKDQRLLFTDLDTSQSKNQKEWTKVLINLHQKWLSYPPNSETIKMIAPELVRIDKEVGTYQAYTALITLMIQNLSLYYY